MTDDTRQARIEAAMDAMKHGRFDDEREEAQVFLFLVLFFIVTPLALCVYGIVRTW